MQSTYHLQPHTQRSSQPGSEPSTVEADGLRMALRTPSGACHKRRRRTYHGQLAVLYVNHCQPRSQRYTCKFPHRFCSPVWSSRGQHHRQRWRGLSTPAALRPTANIATNGNSRLNKHMHGKFIHQIHIHTSNISYRIHFFRGMWRSSHLHSMTFELRTSLAHSKFIKFFKRLSVEYKFMWKCLFYE